MHLIYFEQICYPFSSFQSSFIPIPLLFIPKFMIWLKKTSLLSAAYMYMVVGLSTGMWEPFRGYLTDCLSPRCPLSHNDPAPNWGRDSPIYLTETKLATSSLAFNKGGDSLLYNRSCRMLEVLLGCPSTKVKPNQINNLNKPIIPQKIEAVIKNLPTKRSQCPI